MRRKMSRGGAYFHAGMREQMARRVKLGQTKKDANLNREAVAQVLCYCIMAAARDVLGMSTQELVALTVKMNERAEAYTIQRQAVGAAKARKRLEERSDPLLQEPFILPAGRAFRTENDREVLAERRDAADMVVRYAAEAMDSMGRRKDITALLAEAKANYNQFLGWAEDGEWVAYERLRRVVADVYEVEAEVVQTPGKRPIFAKEF